VKTSGIWLPLFNFLLEEYDEAEVLTQIAGATITGGYRGKYTIAYANGVCDHVEIHDGVAISCGELV